MIDFAVRLDTQNRQEQKKLLKGFYESFSNN